MRFRRLVPALVLLALSGALVAAPISYQGQLDRSGSPYSGTVDMEFALYDAESGGSQVTGPISKSSVEVEQGVFSVSLDFGGGVFDGSPRYLSVSLEGSELSPRQLVGAVPVAQYALSGGGDEAVFQRSGDDAFFNEGTVAVGSATIPQSSPALYARGGSDVAIQAVSTGEHPLHLTRFGDSDQDSQSLAMMELWRGAGDEPEPGMGAGVDFRLQVSNGGFTRTGAIESVLVSPEVPDIQADLVFRTLNTDEASFPEERLRLTHDGQVQLSGDLSFEDSTLQKTAGPIAKGYINTDGSIENAVNVAWASWDDDRDRYRIRISGESYRFDEHVAQITPIHDAVPFRTTSNNGDLIVEFADDGQRGFQFVVYGLPNGIVSNTASVKVSDYHFADKLVEDDDLSYPTDGHSTDWQDASALYADDPRAGVDALVARLNALEAENRVLRHQARRTEQLEDRLDLLEAALLDGDLNEVLQ